MVIPRPSLFLTVGYPGYSYLAQAWVECDGKLLPEYDVSVSGNKVTCWLPSQPGRNFTINWCDTGSGIDSQSFIELDGIVLPGKYIYGHGQARRTGVRTGDHTEKPFVFNKIDRSSSHLTPSLSSPSRALAHPTSRYR